MSAFVVEVPIRTYSPNGSHGHWRVAASRRQTERHTTWRAWLARFLSAPGVEQPTLPAVVTFTRLSAGELDDDNIRAALKGCRDSVALLLGLPITHAAKGSKPPQADDRDPRVTWVYRQEKAKRGTYGVRITVTPREDAR
jgi:hypothetical protein